MTLRIVEVGPARLADIMAVMADAFDPAWGEAWTQAQCGGVLGMPGVWAALAERARPGATRTVPSMTSTSSARATTGGSSALVRTSRPVLSTRRRSPAARW